MTTGLRLAALTVMLCWLLVGCARSIAPTGPLKPVAVTHTTVARAVEVPTSQPVSPTAEVCVGSASASGFSLSLALSASGVADPLKAAVWFVAHGGVSGYGDPSSAWVVTARDVSGATVTAGTVRLHAFLLKNNTWVVDGGQRCGP